MGKKFRPPSRPPCLVRLYYNCKVSWYTRSPHLWQTNPLTFILWAWCSHLSIGDFFKVYCCRSSVFCKNRVTYHAVWLFTTHTHTDGLGWKEYICTCNTSGEEAAAADRARAIAPWRWLKPSLSPAQPNTITACQWHDHGMELPKIPLPFLQFVVLS